MVKVKLTKIHEEAIVPKYAHPGDSGMDIYSVKDYSISPLGRRLIETGLTVEIPLGYEIQVRPKSGLALKSGITVLNTPGTIDSGYRGEIGVILFNSNQESYSVKKGDKIAQIVLQKVETIEFEEVSKLEESVRNTGGFGSTGIK